MSLDAQALFTKALKEGSVYDVFDNVLGLINRQNSEELGIPIGSTDSGEEYGNTFKNAFQWAKSYGNNNEQQLLIDAQNVKVLPGEDREFKVAQKLLSTYKNYADQSPGLVAALDLLTGKLNPQEAREVASYGNTTSFIKDFERGVQNAQAQIVGLERQLQQARPEQKQGIQFELDKYKNILNQRKAQLAQSVNKAQQKYNPELNISSSYEQKDFSNLIDRYGLQDIQEYNPLQIAKDKIASGQGLSSSDYIALAESNKAGAMRGGKTARQLEQELGLEEGAFRKTIVDDFGRQYTPYSGFFADDPVIQERINQSQQTYDVARATAGDMNVNQAQIEAAQAAMPTMSAQQLAQARTTAQGLAPQTTTQSLAAQPQLTQQGLLNQIINDTPFSTYGTTQKYFGQDLNNIKLSNVKSYLDSLDDGSYTALARRILGF